MKKSPLPMKNPTDSGKGSVGKDELEKLLKRHFGHSHFRGKQLEAIQAVLSGRDCFCLMPTGGGKSMCYQIPALAKPGIALVVSPLIALMENQVAALKEKGIPAEFLSSTQVSRVKEKIYEDLDSGNPLVKLLYVTPELIATPGFKSKLSKLHSRGLLSLVAIDEAHCISSWGHDFRPSYRKLSSLRSHLPDVSLLALTATAAPKVQDDVIETLCLCYPLVLRASFNRPNIFYEVRYKELIDDTYLDLSKLIKSNGSACSIVYCLERTTCDKLSGYLLKTGISSAAYHAGLNNKDRSMVLESWVSSKIQVVVATVAFGMGIDRKDVRLVCHLNIPKSMEAFYQESGRAGRDQMPSRSLLYYGLDDRKRMEFILCNAGSKKGQPSSSTNGLAKKALGDFALMVEYCEGSTCRRKKILTTFGEEVSISLCQKTCDTCRYPNKVAASLEELINFKSQKNSFSKIFIKSSLKMAHGEQDTEFWKREDDDESVDEEISDSDDGTEVLSSLSRSKMLLKSRTSKKIDILQRAEEIYYQNKGSNKVGPTTDKKIIHETLREASRQRLLNALKKAQERLGDLTIEFESGASVLETDCYGKFGKAGKTFYNSQVANTVRWLSTSSSSEIKDRVSSCSTHSTACSLNNKLAQAEAKEGGTQWSDPRGSSLQYIVDEEDTKGCSHGSAPLASTGPYLDKIDVLKKNELPHIPSFSEFVDKKHQGGQSKDSKDLNSHRLSKESAEKRRKLD